MTRTVGFALMAVGLITADEAAGQSYQVSGSATASLQTAPNSPAMARFNGDFQSQNRGRIQLAVPEVYELVNVAIALTIKARDEQYLIEKETPYFHAVHAHFAPMSMHPFVQLIDREMRERYDRYFEYKMNAYAFEFDAHNNLVRSPIYDRTGFSKDPVNHLLPHVALLQDFARRSGFRQFYARHQALYDEQAASFQQVGVAGMMAWLKANFPSQKPYDFVNVIFSPLVSGSQSATWMESAGFSEVQAHVNFPYPRPSHAELSPQAQLLRRGYVVFTELNHGYINPLGDRYEQRIEAAITPGPNWAEPGKTAAGYSAVPFFNEMMNWALVSLYLSEKAPAAERAKLLEDNDKYMLGRGFVRFPEFTSYLIAAHQKGATVEALYPQVIEWFAQRNRVEGATGS